MHRGETHSQRVSVVIGLSVQLPMDLVQAVMSMAQVFKEQTLAQALSDAAELGEELPAARIFGDASEGAVLSKLQAEADPECVVFANRGLEARWQRQVLGYGDAGQ